MVWPARGKPLGMFVLLGAAKRFHRRFASSKPSGGFTTITLPPGRP